MPIVVGTGLLALYIKFQICKIGIQIKFILEATTNIAKLWYNFFEVESSTSSLKTFSLHFCPTHWPPTVSTSIHLARWLIQPPSKQGGREGGREGGIQLVFLNLVSIVMIKMEHLTSKLSVIPYTSNHWTKLVRLCLHIYTKRKTGRAVSYILDHHKILLVSSCVSQTLFYFDRT